MSHVLSTLADVKGDIKSVEGEVKELRGDVQGLGVEFHSFKTEVAKEFGLVRTEMEKGFGSLRVWVLLTIGGAVVSAIGALVGLHALKLF